MAADRMDHKPSPHIVVAAPTCRRPKMLGDLLESFARMEPPATGSVTFLIVDNGPDAPVADVVAAGYDRATVKKVEHLIYISEYKRFQSAPGVRLTKKAFWLDRRYPIVNRWRDET